MSPFNLFNPKPMSGQVESLETLLECRNVSIERIHSPARTHSELYIQEQDEWVCLVQGEATLEMDSKIISLHCGEALFIPSGVPHRVLNTSKDPLCIWLAVHIH